MQVGGHGTACCPEVPLLVLSAELGHEFRHEHINCEAERLLHLPIYCLVVRSPTDNETRMFYEIVVAPGYTPEGLEVLKGKSKALRILEAKPRPPSGRSLRQVAGGWLMQVCTTHGFQVCCESRAPPAAAVLWPTHAW